MQLHTYPDSLEEKLGFDVLRTRLRHYVLSTLGEEQLRAMIPLVDLEYVHEAMWQVAEMQDALRFDDPVPFEGELDIRSILHRIQPANTWISGEELRAVWRVLQTTRRLRSYFERRREKYPYVRMLARQLVALPELEQHIERVVDERGVVRDTASPELQRLRKQIVRLRARLREVIAEELQRAISLGYAAETRPTIRNGRMVIPIRAEAKRKMEGFIHDVSASGQTVYLEPVRALQLNNEVRELEVRERREIERILREITAALREALEVLHRNEEVLGRLDLLQAKARLCNELQTQVPRLNRRGYIHLKDARNPVLVLHYRERAEEGKPAPEVVPLNMELGKDYWTLVITGPNAGGKTVAMKTVGLLSLMASYGMPVPAHAASEVALFDALMVDIGDEQSVQEDLSTFSSHLMHMDYMVRNASPQVLNLIDEAGTGTDPAEGAALAQAILEELTREKARTIATTHHGALKVFAFETPGVENGSMQFDTRTLRPTYRFIPGVPGSSYAFEIARRLGLPESIIERARQLVGTQKAALDELLRALELRMQELEARLAEAQRARAEAEAVRKRYESLMARLEEEETAIRERALTEAQRLIAEANARIERTIREIREAQAAREATREARKALESFQRSLARKKSRVARRPSRHGAGPTTPLKVGDQVLLDEGTAVAEVLEIHGNEAVISRGPLRMRVGLDRLRKVGGPRPQQVQVRQVSSSGSLPVTQVQTRLDVRGKRVHEALAEVTRFIDDAVAAGLEQVEILHGKGTGALRTAIQEWLATHPHVTRFEEALPEEGGAGITRVFLT